MSRKRSVLDADVAGKRVLTRVDFNVPIKDGRVTDDSRVRAALPTINHLVRHGARVILMSHLGRPAGTGYEEAFSLKPVADHLATLVDAKVSYVRDVCGEQARAAADALRDGEVLVLENLRFEAGEKKNDPAFARALASLGDLYVDDAFGVSHRAHASVVGVPELLPAYAGLLLAHEVETITGMLEDPRRPFVAVLGGSKVSDKIGVIDRLIDTVDTLLVGGGMAFTFVKAQGHDVGTSLLEQDWVQKAGEMVEKARAKGCDLVLPVDYVVADRFADDATTEVVAADAIPDGMMGLDVGPRTVELYAAKIAQARTIFWNGPMGVFEMPSFEAGTRGVAQAIADNAEANSIVGGGDSGAAVNQFGLADRMTFVSTGGGASMKLVEGEALPGVEAIPNA
ncbi:phosphoglycerate kinase [bacterium]|nr:phosphoglycerate kinase [bacterium]